MEMHISNLNGFNSRTLWNIDIRDWSRFKEDIWQIFVKVKSIKRVKEKKVIEV